MSRIRVIMMRDNLEDIPEYQLPEGFTLRLFEEGDQEDWARVETAADEFESEVQALERFNEEFGPHLAEFKKRCLFIENEAKEIIGTTTAWYGSEITPGEVIGRIHWVSIVPEYQGKGLAKPLLTEAMKILQKYHKKAYLTSSTVNYKGINMYLQYGFEPVIENQEDLEAWTILKDLLALDDSLNP